MNVGEPLRREVDIAIVGAGPAGLAVAARLAEAGAVVDVFEREREAGGIPRHSHHTGFGVRDLHRVLTGPEYARRRIDQAVERGATVRVETTVTGWAGPRELEVVSPAGLERVAARAVILATGARERPRSARLVPGDRPAGVFTTGELQQAVYLHGERIGQKAVIVGAEHVSFSAALTLHHGGARVAAMVTALPSQQSYAAFRFGAAVRFRFPVLASREVVAIHGRRRVEGIELRTRAGGMEHVACDTLVFTGDWIPDHELARRGGLEVDAGTNGPAVDAHLETSVPGVFAVGNLVHPVETADLVAREAERLAPAVLAFLERGEPERTRIPIRVEPPLGWICPNRAGATTTRPFLGWFTFRTAVPLSRVRLVVEQGGRQLHERRHARQLVPNRPYRLAASWLPDVDPTGDHVVVRVR
jgi:thioredoxin reductase